MKNTYIIGGVVIVLVALLGGYALWSQSKVETVVVEREVTPAVPAETVTPSTPEVTASSTPTPTEQTIGTSVQGKTITAYTYGTGAKKLLIVGGVHGGYSWNTASLAYELINHYQANEGTLDDVTVTIIPVLNPDGLDQVTTKRGVLTTADITASASALTTARFNNRKVDLNRNFDCEWSASGTWQSQTVSGGSAAFSEPEAAALRDFVRAYDPDAAIVYFSAAGGVYASDCGAVDNAASQALVATYGTASGYRQFASYDYYAITGDMVNWMAKQSIPAISVVLTDHTNTERTKNLAGVEAVIASLNAAE